MKTVGTLIEIGAKVGDMVRHPSACYYRITSTEPDSLGCWPAVRVNLNIGEVVSIEPTEYWEIASRAEPKPTFIGIDLAKPGSEFTVMPIHVAPGYDKLFQVLNGALHQAQAGKGNERHSRGEAFQDQPILTITRRRGIGFTLGQVEKKVDEADGMISRGERGAAVKELLGAINYLAATVIYLDEQSDQT